MLRSVGSLAVVCTGAVLLLGSAVPPGPDALPAPNGAAAVAAPVAPPKPPVRKPPTVEQARDKGVLIVVSIPAQRVFVFKDGSPWGSAPVSTGRRGHDTPLGVFPILQKSVAHRSTLYNDAPMPYMQRLTWGGVALHGGNVSRYRASHGCIRLPHGFARDLFKITAFSSTAVLVTGERVPTAHRALALVGGRALPHADQGTRFAVRPSAPSPALPAGPTETVQLAAVRSAQNAGALWADLVRRQPPLASLQPAVVPAVVNSVQVYRLRASGAGAADICRRVASAGTACFTVRS